MTRRAAVALRRLRGTVARRVRRAFRGRVARLAESRGAEEPAVLTLDSVRRRLELWLAALHGRDFPIQPLADPPARGLVARWLGPPAHLRARWRVAQSDGEAIRLPATIDAAGSTDEALARYRLLALQHATRIVRGTAQHTPGDDRPL
ncbi:MAG TPA: hypothetical protein VEA99_04090, partial [Gemmatimonadaceae bacterium]|nr:hypothetical protein [Gemmatimonadaceae bacterium]